MGSEVIEPMHFLLAALKIVDVDFPVQLDKLDISSEVWKGMCKDARKVRGYSDVLPEKITTVRWRIRHRFARTAQPPIPDGQVIHRSRKTRAAFHDVAREGVYGIIFPWRREERNDSRGICEDNCAA